MAVKSKPHLTPQEYLAIDRAAERKSEYYGGEMFLMAGASEAHNLIAVNVSSALHGQLRGRPCRTYPSDMRVKVSETGLYTYPDVVVVCGEPEFEDEHRDTLLNPTVLVEILSPSTETYDRGKKAAQYRQLASLQEYLLIAQDRPHVERYRRHEGQEWILSEASDLGATVRLGSIGCELELSAVYERVEFPDETNSEA